MQDEAALFTGSLLDRHPLECWCVGVWFVQALMPRHNDVEIREDIEQNINCPEGRVSDFAQYFLINHTKQLKMWRVYGGWRMTVLSCV